MTFTPNDVAPTPVGADPGELPIANSWIPSPLPAAFLCFVMSLAMHLPWLGVTPIAGTEGHRIFPAHEMVLSHDWLVPMLFGKPFMTKPPLHLWLIALSELIAGRGNVLVWRLPSVIGGAALCAAVCLLGGRWFGRTAALISGMSAVGMIAIWGQSQVADIDSTNTLAAALAAFCGIELFIALPSRKWPWVAAASAAMAATWMTKGPAGLPIVGGVWIWAAVVAIREKRARSLASPAFWLPLVLGAAVFLAWGLAARASLRRQEVPVDLRGVQEATTLDFSHLFPAFIKSLFVMLPQLIAFAFPISASLPFFFNRGVRDKIEPSAQRIARALAAAVLISWAIAVIAATIKPDWANPRYFYPTLLPLCPLAGAVAVAAAKTKRSADWLRGAAIATSLLLTGAAVGLAVASWKVPHFHAGLIGNTLLTLIVAAWSIRRMRTSWKGAWGIVALALLAAVPFGSQRHWSRTNRDSGIHSAARLKAIVGEHSAVAVGGMVTSKPETLTYADARVNYFPDHFLPKNVEPGTWVLLDDAERRQWLRVPGVRLEKEQWLCRNGKTDYYVAWYAGR